ncbi:hypothetical protein Fot_56101 [Forsythia ovata]|uniref:Uncharacterized protein n=1 Tax=Forsythia ovata TaxID=205694 RepID=A0ABD1P3N4_9LAMI
MANKEIFETFHSMSQKKCRDTTTGAVIITSEDSKRGKSYGVGQHKRGPQRCLRGSEKRCGRRRRASSIVFSRPVTSAAADMCETESESDDKGIVKMENWAIGL